MKGSLLLATFLLPLSVSAQTIDVRPGLWEHHIELKSQSGRLELALEMAKTQMALLPPEQRQMVEGVIEAQGLKVDWVNQTFQNCVTEAEAASGRFKFAEDGGCTINRAEPNGLSTHVEFTCAQGQGSLQLANGIEYTGQSNMTLNFNGFIEQASATHSGQWLGASCGAVGQ